MEAKSDGNTQANVPCLRILDGGLRERWLNLSAPSGPLPLVLLPPLSAAQRAREAHSIPMASPMMEESLSCRWR